MRAPPASYLPAALVAGAALLPILVLVDVAAPAASLERLLAARNLELLWTTVAFTLAGTAGAVLIGVPLALLSASVRLPLPTLWLVLLAAPLALPSYLGAFAFYAFFGPGGELEALSGLRTPSAHGFAGAALVMALYTYPFVLLTTRAALLGQDANLVHAARLLGLGPAACMLRIVLPRAAGGIAAGALLAALYVLSDFGTPAILGVDNFTRLIYVEYNAFGLPQAALLSLQLLSLVGLLLLVEGRITAPTERTGRPLLYERSATSMALALGISVPVVLLAIALPLGVFGLWLLRDGVIAFEAAQLWQSALVALAAALLAVLLALPLAQAATRGVFGRIAERVSYFGFGVPGIVMGTALVLLGLELPILYQTFALLVLAYVFRFLPLAVGSIRSVVERLDPNLVDAARLLGASPAQAFRRVVVPLALPGVVAGAALVFLEVMRELPATLLLAPTGFETLATYLWRVYEAGLFGQAALPGLLLIALSAAGLALVLLGERRSAFSVREESAT